MDPHEDGKASRDYSEEDLVELRRGPWTVDEDFTLINYIAHHGEGRWNSLARSAGLKRTGKSCRLRWLNYLRPDVRRGNLSPEEQLLILELHSRWGNRWSKIAQHLPGRTDNEIKNYWRTRVQKHAKQLKCDVNSKKFKDTMRYLWMPRLVERIQASANTNLDSSQITPPHSATFTPDNSSAAASSDSLGTPVSDLTACYDHFSDYEDQSLTSPTTAYFNQGLDFVDQNAPWTMDGADLSDTFWDVDDVWFLQHQFNSNS